MDLHSIAAEIAEFETKQAGQLTLFSLRKRLDAVRPTIPFDVEPPLEPTGAELYMTNHPNRELRAQYELCRQWAALNDRLRRLAEA